MKNARQVLLVRAKTVIDTARSQGRDLTPAEADEVTGILVRVDEIKRNGYSVVPSKDDELQRSLDRFHGFSGPQGASLAAKARETENFLGGTPALFGAKDVLADATIANPQRFGGIEGMKLDQRYLFANMETGDLDGTTSKLEGLVQTTRSLADSASMVMPFAATGEKPATTVGVDLVDFAVSMVATLSEPIPNAILAQSMFEDLVDVTLRQAYREALDAHVAAELITAAGTTSNTGADLFEQIRHAKENLESLGFAPNLVAVSPADATTLDLSRAGGSAAGDGPFILNPAPRDVASSPLWGMKVVTAKNVSDPIVLDTSAAGRLHVGAVALSVNPYQHFSTNQSILRLEGPMALVIRQTDAIHVIAAGI